MKGSPDRELAAARVGGPSRAGRSPTPPRAGAGLWPEGEWLRAVFEASRDGILVEEDERISHVNGAYARLFGYADPAELIGRRVSVVLSPEDEGRMLEYGRRRGRGEAAPAVYEFRGRRKDGLLIALEASVSTFRAGGKTHITTAVRDIAERKRAEAALHASECKYRQLLEQASDGIHTYGPDGNFLETNSKFSEMLGYTPEELSRLNVSDLLSAEELAASPILFDELRRGRTVLSERRLRRKDGSFIPVEISGRMVREGVFQSIIRDITERKRAERALREAHDELESRVLERTAELYRTNASLQHHLAEQRRASELTRRLRGRLMTAQEDEGRRISRELHDGAGQDLAALAVALQTLERKLQKGSFDPARDGAELARLCAMARGAQRGLRRAAHALHPSVLEHFGLVEALRGFLREACAGAGARYSMRAEQPFPRLTPAAEVSAYRITQEAVVNALRHGGARKVSVRARRAGGHVLVTVRDDGCGFDVGGAAARGGVGLVSMRERAEMIGAEVEVSSADGRGTTVRLRVPLGAGDAETAQSAAALWAGAGD